LSILVFGFSGERAWEASHHMGYFQRELSLNEISVKTAFSKDCLAFVCFLLINTCFFKTIFYNTHRFVDAKTLTTFRKIRSWATVFTKLCSISYL